MFWILLIILVVIAGWVITMFNGLVILKNRVNEAASDIDVQLKRRHDLIPNLISTVQGYATHERELLEKVTQARTQAMQAQGMAEKGRTENMLTDTLKSLFAVAENYPELKANQNFLALQEELSDTENKIMSSRRFYNTNVRDYNIRTEIFPTSIIANWFSFKKRELFEVEDVAMREVPKVDFGSQTTEEAPVATPPVTEAPTATPPVVSPDQHPATIKTPEATENTREDDSTLS